MDFTLGLVHHALDFGDPVVVLRRAAHDAVSDSQGVARGLRLPVLGVRAREGGVVGQRPLVWRQALAGLPHAVELCIRLLPALHLEIEVHTGTDEPEDGDDAEDDEQDRTFTIFLYALVERIAEEELASCDALGAWLRAAGQAVMAAAVWSRRWRDRRLTRQRGSPAGGAVGGDVGLTIVRDYGGALHRARVALVAVVSVAPTGAAAQNDESGVGTDAHGARGVDCPGAAPKAAAAATSLVVDTDTVGIEPVVAVEPERHDLGGIAFPRPDHRRHEVPLVVVKQLLLLHLADSHRVELQSRVGFHGHQAAGPHAVDRVVASHDQGRPSHGFAVWGRKLGSSELPGCLELAGAERHLQHAP
mmetsp:Transcript_78843/g.249176  ORF Transcript_78843/g.249176 Transcript_78843/m.249176 type:complete len:360 (-) Transcript_78843:293-1372(-)